MQMVKNHAYNMCYPDGEVNISHETTTLVVWIYDGI